MPARVVVLGFDAMEATLVERWASEGMLPTFRELMESGTLFRPANRVDTLPSTIWTELTTGRLGGTIGWYWNRSQVFAGEAALRQARDGDCDLTAVWSLASEGGRRVAALDVPQAEPAPRLNGIQIREWGNHETAFGFGTEPPSFADELLRRFGRYPGPRGDACEVHKTREDELELRDEILAGVAARTQLYEALLRGSEWDLFFGAFVEAHCVSHQFWGYLGDDVPPGDDVRTKLATAIPDVYCALDASLRRLTGGLGPDTFVFVVLSHGMGPEIGGPQLLPEVLVRLGYGSGHGVASNVRSRMPAPVKEAVKRIVRGPLRRRLQTAAGSLPQPLESPQTRAMAVPNGRCGAIRLNVRGRDPFGTIEPGAEYDAVCAELIEAIEELERVDTGGAAVTSVVRADAVYGSETHPNIPDLVVRFDESGPITEVRSARVGVIGKPLREHAINRTGDHTPHSRILAIGPGIAAGRVASTGDVLDLAPTILELLDVPVPQTLHGKPLPLDAAVTA